MKRTFVTSGAALLLFAAMPAQAQAPPTDPPHAVAAAPAAAPAEPTAPGAPTTSTTPSAAGEADAGGDGEEASAADPAAASDGEAADDPAAGLEPIGDDQKRPVPNYDGREEEPVDAGDVFLWVPRIILAPAYFVSEYILRWPLGAIVTAAEKHDVPDAVVSFFTFGPDDNAGLVPTTIIDFGFRPAIGLYFWWDDYLAKDNDLRLRATFGGVRWWMANIAHRTWLVPDETKIETFFEFHIRPDWYYYGVGPESRHGDMSRYQDRSFEGGLRFESTNLWRSSGVRTYAAVRDMTFEDETCCDDPSIGEKVAAGAYPWPDHFEEGYFAILTGLAAAFDTREPRHLEVEEEGSDFVSPPGSGLRVAGRVELGSALRAAPLVANGTDQPMWVKYGGTVGGFIDLTGQQRVLGLSGIVDFADPLDDTAYVPFTELSMIGGEGPMRGFRDGRLRGRSLAVARLEYRWPVWVYLDGMIQYSVGNVFGEHLEDFDFGLLRQSFAGGFRANGSRDHTFEILAGFGTETFDGGAEAEDFRLVIGTSAGF